MTEASFKFAGKCVDGPLAGRWQAWDSPRFRVALPPPLNFDEPVAQNIVVETVAYEHFSVGSEQSEVGVWKVAA